MFHLDGQDIPGLQLYLNRRPGSSGNEVVLRAEKPGEGNMNYVLRVTTLENSFIIKQSRPYVEKYPQIPAPSGRAEVEVAFYNAIRQDEVLKSYTPELLWADDINHIIALEDLGQSKDFSDIYKMQRKLSIEETTQLVLFINRLNNNVAKTNNPLLKNKAMRELNHQHIFQFPFMEDNGFNLDTVQSGLQLLAMKYKSDSVLKESIYLLGEIYLQDGNSLVHGDFYPGSWLHTDNGIKIIDPEFCFLSSEPFPFKNKHAEEIQKILPNAQIKIVDGEMFSWYGSRLLKLPKYIKELKKEML